MAEPLDMTEPFGAWLERKIKERGLNQRQLALMIGASTGMVSGWCHDKRKPRPENCARIAVALGVPEEEVLVRAGYRQPKDTDIPPKKAELLRVAEMLPLSQADLAIDLLHFLRRRALLGGADA